MGASRVAGRFVFVPVVLALAGGLAPRAQRDVSEVEIRATHVAGSVWVLEGRGGNIGVSVGPDGILIVDDQFAPLADKIRTALGRIGGGKLRFVLNTHWHGDHTGGNAAFGREAPIIAHSNVRKRLAAPQQLRGETVAPAAKESLPVITFDESLSVHFNGEEIQVIHFPRGHTDGDSVIFFTGSNVIHMGDHLFAGRFPFVDLDSGGDVEHLAGNVEAVLARLPAGAKIIPGHGGPVATADDLRAYLGMLRQTIAIVRERMAAGRTLEQIQAEGLPDKWKGWGDGFIGTDDWLRTVWDSLSRAGDLGRR